MNYLVKKLISTGVKLSSTNSAFSRNISLYKSLCDDEKTTTTTTNTAQPATTTTIGDDWFKKLTVNNQQSEINANNSEHDQMYKRRRFIELSESEKLEYIKALHAIKKEARESTPKILTDEAIKILMQSESYIHLDKTFRFLAKEEYYKQLKEKKQQEKLERIKSRKECLDGNKIAVVTNYPGRTTFIKRIDTSSQRFLDRCKVLTSIVTNEPNVVFDFRFINLHTRVEVRKSLYREFIEVIHQNRDSARPFQLHFCNYDYESKFHQEFSTMLNLDSNLVHDSPKSYLDIFPKEKLVYLSKDAKRKMTTYDPNKVYVIGSIVDSSRERFIYSSFSQAKKDGIACERLPLDDFIRWKKGHKDLNVNTVFEILLKLKHGMSWEESLLQSLPTRKYEKHQDDDNENEREISSIKKYFNNRNFS